MNFKDNGYINICVHLLLRTLS